MDGHSGEVWKVFFSLTAAWDRFCDFFPGSWAGLGSFFLNQFGDVLIGPFGDRRHTKLNMQNRRFINIPATWERIFRIFGHSNSVFFLQIVFGS